MVKVRPPKWKTCEKSLSRDRFNLGLLKEKQQETLCQFRKHAAQNNWDGINSDHFDWWMFPIDDGRLADFNLSGEDDVKSLLNDPDWVSSYRESIILVCKAMGWDLGNQEPIHGLDCPQWQQLPFVNKDVRLAKMIRSSWLLEVRDIFESLQAFAHYINDSIYNGKGFFYGSICLDEILHMDLPRRT